MTIIPLLRRPARPSAEAMQRATIRTYQMGAITPPCAVDQLIKHGMKPVDAAREVADAIQL